MGLVIGRSASRNASVQANTIEHILIGDKEYEPKTVGAKKNAVCLPDNPYELWQGEGHDEAYDLLGSFLASAYQASVAGVTSKGIELTSDQQDALDDLMTLPSLIHYPDQGNEGLFFCFGDPGHRVTIICIPGAYVIGKLQHNLSAITITIDDYRYAKVCLNTLSTLAKNGDGTKFLNDKGEYADPVAGVKSSVAALAPYDCSWIFKLTSGTEITQAQWSELSKLIESGRPLFAYYKERTASVIGIEDGHSDSRTTMTFILFDGYDAGYQCYITDDVTEESHYAEIFVSSWELQRLLVSGTNIKTVNGQPLLGAGDIALPVPTKVSQLANDAGYLSADALETFTDASELSVTCESGRIQQGNNIATLTVGCSASDDSQAAEERIIFSTGPSVEGITVTGVSWANGDTPSFKANKVYEISVSYIPLLGKFLATYAEY